MDLSQLDIETILAWVGGAVAVLTLLQRALLTVAKLTRTPKDDAFASKTGKALNWVVDVLGRFGVDQRPGKRG